MKTMNISEAVIRRLPIYLRCLNDLLRYNIRTISSQELGQKLDLNAAQIRKDLAYFGEFGKKGIGYDVEYVIDKIKQILKLDQDINVALVGAGNLGRALSNYNAYQNDKMKIVAIFDSFSQKVGEQILQLTVQSMEELKETVRSRGIRIGIITVPAHEAQAVANQFVDAGVEAILNFAPVILKVPSHIQIQYADFTMELHSLAFYLNDKPATNK